MSNQRQVKPSVARARARSRDHKTRPQVWHTRAAQRDQRLKSKRKRAATTCENDHIREG